MHDIGSKAMSESELGRNSYRLLECDDDAIINESGFRGRLVSDRAVPILDGRF